MHAINVMVEVFYLREIASIVVLAVLLVIGLYLALRVVRNVNKDMDWEMYFIYRTLFNVTEIETINKIE